MGKALNVTNALYESQPDFTIQGRIITSLTELRNENRIGSRTPTPLGMACGMEERRHMATFKEVTTKLL